MEPHDAVMGFVNGQQSAYGKTIVTGLGVLYPEAFVCPSYET